METVDLGGDALDIWKISVDFDVFDTSSSYVVDADWPLGQSWPIRFVGSSTQTVSDTFEFLPAVKDGSGWYWTVSFEMREDSSDWIEVYIFLDPIGNVSHATDYDSDGNSYYVSLTVE